MARRGLTVKAVENLQARGVRYEIPDPGCAGLYLQVHPIGTAYTEAGVEVLKIGDARDTADEARVLVAKRVDPAQVKKDERKKEAPESTFRAVAEMYFDQHRKLRTVGQREKAFDRLVYPVFGDRHIEGIRRSEIVALLDRIAKAQGPVMADYVLAMIRRLLQWHATRSDDYASPIVRGMARTSTKERARTRVLSKFEIRVLWRAADKAGMFGSYLQFVLLTATRRNEAAHIRRAEIEATEWTIPAARYKTKLDHVVPLSPAASAVLAKVPKIGRCDFVFTPDGKKPIGGFGCRKEVFDGLMLAELRRLAEEEGEDPADVQLKRWTLHDLRRTARTLMSELAVPSEHAEACLGHVRQGVEGTYDRHQYRAEKQAAFAKLADLVDRIVTPGSNVVAFAESA
jgi:integrase